MTQLLVATRSAHKLREIRQLMGPVPGLEIVDLEAAGIPEEPAEDAIEAFDTFEENALAKARYFAARAPFPVLADDSGLCVDALGGGPGIFSKRFSGEPLSGIDLDLANNRRLLHELGEVPDPQRTAHYVCVVALVTPEGDEDLFRGTVDGTILRTPRGDGGFGYDPLFYLPSLEATFAEVAPETKNQISHRARALQAALPRLRQLAATPI